MPFGNFRITCCSWPIGVCHDGQGQGRSQCTCHILLATISWNGPWFWILEYDECDSWLLKISDNRGPGNTTNMEFNDIWNRFTCNCCPWTVRVCHDLDSRSDIISKDKATVVYTHNYTPRNEVRGGILESPCPSVCL